MFVDDGGFDGGSAAPDSAAVQDPGAASTGQPDTRGQDDLDATMQYAEKAGWNRDSRFRPYHQGYKEWREWNKSVKPQWEQHQQKLQGYESELSQFRNYEHEAFGQYRDARDQQWEKWLKDAGVWGPVEAHLKQLAGGSRQGQQQGQQGSQIPPEFQQSVDSMRKDLEEIKTQRIADSLNKTLYETLDKSPYAKSQKFRERVIPYVRARAQEDYGKRKNMVDVNIPAYIREIEETFQDAFPLEAERRRPHPPTPGLGARGLPAGADRETKRQALEEEYWAKLKQEANQ